MLAHFLFKYDTEVLTKKYRQLIKYEKQIRGEFSYYSNEEYKKQRLSFLNHVKKVPEVEIRVDDFDRLIKYVEGKY